MDSGKPFSSGTDRHYGAFRNLQRAMILGLAAVVLVHGMVASQLLVVCVRADGVTLIEMIGQDPCRHPLGEAGCCSRHSLLVLAHGFDDEPGPCVDLSLSRPAMAQQDPDLDRALAAAGAPDVDAMQVAASLPLTPRTMMHRFPREPVPSQQKSPLSPPPLRI